MSENELPEGGPEVTAKVIEGNPSYAPQKTAQEVEQEFLKRKLGITSLEERVAALENEAGL